MGSTRAGGVVTHQATQPCHSHCLLALQTLVLLLLTCPATVEALRSVQRRGQKCMGQCMVNAWSMHGRAHAMHGLRTARPAPHRMPHTCAHGLPIPRLVARVHGHHQAGLPCESAAADCDLVPEQHLSWFCCHGALCLLRGLRVGVTAPLNACGCCRVLWRESTSRARAAPPAAGQRRFGSLRGGPQETLAEMRQKHTPSYPSIPLVTGAAAAAWSVRQVALVNAGAQASTVLRGRGGVNDALPSWVRQRGTRTSWQEGSCRHDAGMEIRCICRPCMANILGAAVPPTLMQQVGDCQKGGSIIIGSSSAACHAAAAGADPCRHRSHFG